MSPKGELLPRGHIVCTESQYFDPVVEVCSECSDVCNSPDTAFFCQQYCFAYYRKLNPVAQPTSRTNDSGSSEVKAERLIDKPLFWTSVLSMTIAVAAIIGVIVVCVVRWRASSSGRRRPRVFRPIDNTSNDCDKTSFSKTQFNDEQPLFLVSSGEEKSKFCSDDCSDPANRIMNLSNQDYDGFGRMCINQKKLSEAKSSLSMASDVSHLLPSFSTKYSGCTIGKMEVTRLHTSDDEQIVHLMEEETTIHDKITENSTSPPTSIESKCYDDHYQFLEDGDIDCPSEVAGSFDIQLSDGSLTSKFYEGNSQNSFLLESLYSQHTWNSPKVTQVSEIQLNDLCRVDKNQRFDSGFHSLLVSA